MKKQMHWNSVSLLSMILLLFIAASSCSSPGDAGMPSEQQPADIQDRLSQLEAREAIRGLLIQYGQCLDRRDFSSFANLFAEKDGEWIGGMGRAKGRQAIQALMEDKIGTSSGKTIPPNYHLFMNESIDLDGNRASAVTKWLFVVSNPDGSPKPMLLGHYNDDLVLEEEGWKFLRRVVYSDIPQDNPE